MKRSIRCRHWNGPRCLDTPKAGSWWWHPKRGMPYQAFRGGGPAMTELRRIDGTYFWTPTPTLYRDYVELGRAPKMRPNGRVSL